MDKKHLAALLHHENSVFQEIELILASGEVALDIEREKRETEPDTQRDGKLFTDSIKDTTRIFWDIETQKAGSNEPNLVFLLGLKSPDGSNAWGSLRAEIPLAEVVQHINEVKYDEGDIYLKHASLGILPLSTLESYSEDKTIAAFPWDETRWRSTENLQTFDTSEGRFFYVVTDVIPDELQVITILHGDQFHAAARQTRSILVYLTAAMILIGAFLARYLGGKVVRPLQRIAIATEKMASGHLAEIDDTRAPGELRGILLSFNEMVRKLRQTMVSRDYIESIFVSTREGIMVVTLEGAIEKVNQAASSLLGYPEDELVGMHCRQVFADKEKDWLELLTEGAGKNSERVLLHSLGQTRKVQFSWALFNNMDGETQGVVCIFQETTPLRTLSRRPMSDS